MDSKSTTARLATGTLAFQVLCLLAVLLVYALGHFGTSDPSMATEALQVVGTIALGGAGGGGLGTYAYGMRHRGTRAPTSAMARRRDPLDPDTA